MYITIRFVTNGSVVQISRKCRIDENQSQREVTSYLEHKAAKSVHSGTQKHS